MQLSEAMAKTPNREADDQIYEMQVRICKSFANPTRLRMLDLLARREYSVSDLQTELGITAPNVSQHLSILKGAGVVATRCAAAGMKKRPRTSRREGRAGRSCPCGHPPARRWWPSYTHPGMARLRTRAWTDGCCARAHTARAPP